MREASAKGPHIQCVMIHSERFDELVSKSLLIQLVVDQRPSVYATLPSSVRVEAGGCCTARHAGLGQAQGPPSSSESLLLTHELRRQRPEHATKLERDVCSGILFGEDVVVDQGLPGV